MPAVVDARRATTGAEASGTPNFDSACPVAIASMGRDHDLGDHPQQDRLDDAGSARDRAETFQLRLVVDDHGPDPLAHGERELLVGLRVPMEQQALGRRAGMEARQQLPSRGAEQIEPFLERDPDHRGARHRLHGVRGPRERRAHRAHAYTDLVLVEHEQRRAEVGREVHRVDPVDRQAARFPPRRRRPGLRHRPGPCARARTPPRSRAGWRAPVARRGTATDAPASSSSSSPTTLHSV